MTHYRLRKIGEGVRFVRLTFKAAFVTLAATASPAASRSVLSVGEMAIIQDCSIGCH
jgi:hypothetical protein